MRNRRKGDENGEEMTRRNEKKRKSIVNSGSDKSEKSLLKRKWKRMGIKATTVEEKQ